MSSDKIPLNYSGSLKKFSRFRHFYPKKNIADTALHFDTAKSISANLKHLSTIALDPSLTTAFLHSLDQIFLDFVSRWISDSSIEQGYLQLKQLDYKIKGSIVLSALARIVPLAPEIAPLIEYFLEKNDVLQALQALQSSSLPSEQPVKEDEIREVLLAFYRILHHDHERFSKFITSDILLDLLRSSSNPTTNYLALQILSKYLDFAESAKNKMLQNHIGDSSLLGTYETDQGIDYRLLPVLEAKRLSNYYQLKASIDDSTEDDTFINIESSDLSTLVVSVCGVLVPKIHFDQQTSRSEGFVPTERSIDILRKLAFHAQHSSPVMLIGGAGSGKTFIINELSKYLACYKTMVKIHLGEQTDAKLLLGTYTSGQKPGTFEWRHGVLTTAVKEGRWVLIEDIDKAPTEVLSILLSLLEKRELTIPSRGETIKAANGFQLISTIRKSSDSKKSNIPDLIGLRLWEKLTLEDPSKEELVQILSTKYPLLHKMIPSFIKLYEGIQDTYHRKSFLLLNKGSHPRTVSVRDLIKFCNRVNALFHNNNIADSNTLLQSSVVDDIFAEAVDCFVSAVSEAPALSPLITSIGEALEIPPSRVQLFLNKHVPAYEDFENRLVVGRAHLTKAPKSLYRKKNTGNSTSFARTNHSLRLMEQIGVSIQMTEPVLLVGETGTGKTTVVQQIAKQLNKQITVINVSQQTETGDLLGGFKPVNTKTVAVPIQEEFLNLFHLTFSAKKNEKFEKMLIKCFNRTQWKNVVKLWNEAVKLARQVLNKQEDETVGEEGPKKKRRLNSNDKILLLQKWDGFQDSVKNFEIQSETMKNSFVFNFVEGSLVQAVKNGDWLLLDEINLASPDTLESISDLLSDVATQRSILLSEKGEVESIQAHPDFRIFGCMNPATDVGKRDLPLSIRSRFTEIYVHSPDADISDLLQIIDKYVGRYALNDEWVGNDIAQLYLEAKKLAESNQIVDGANQKPHFSIRTLTRTLLYVCDIVSIYGLRRSLFEGFSMSFLTLLDQKSESILRPLIEKYTIGRLKNAKSVISQIPPAPSAEDGSFVQFKHYWMKQGTHEVTSPNYIITPFVEKNLLNLVRATSGKRFPILVQGPTSSGKTSMIKYLAEITGNKFVRINNHEHTDLQEYLGTYISDDTGKLSFKEGVLVEALRNGHWLVLDELNLAPTDVLEALNRLLDDNRELFISETQEVVHPHPDFMLFATQNPPGLYGGRKILSRAFRNRFLELHFDDIPQDELEVILRERCQIAPSYAKKIVEVYRQLSIQRQSSRLFEQKNSFATLRDLFRWAMREAVGYGQLAANGYMLLAERVRKPEEKLVVKEILEKVMKVKLDMDEYYDSLENKDILRLESSVVWTKAIRRLAVLISTSLSNNEPILLVGETGCGKTTVCQLLAEFNGKKLITVNAHQNTETGDLLGAQRPVRNKSEAQNSLALKITEVLQGLSIPDIAEDLDDLLSAYDSIEKSSVPEELQGEIQNLRNGLNVLFEWTDGPLIHALKTGEYFLLDEISLADDSVLERLNSVLEPERSLLLAEKGSDDSFITASEGFQFLATMNPGGDYGKKELSPALRNRFTEIWVPSMEDFEDVKTIVEAKLTDDLKTLAPAIVSFSEKFGRRLGGGNISSGVISLRDILAWVQFVNSSYSNTGSINGSLVHGASMVFVDALGTNNTAHLAESEEKLNALKLECIQELSELVNEDLSKYYTERVSIEMTEDAVIAGMFQLPINKDHAGREQFSFEAPTTASNAMRVIRALQLTKPILLEGSPGVGKTSLVSALAKATGNPLTRINLSEQTDLVDLFGSDAPVEGGKTGEFAWRDAPFLRAMQKGEWVLLDEMNLASQSVLEGLNACLDHRGEAYIPELDKSFARHPNFLVFGAQNPQYQGGGRKGLPKSFVNRFSVVYVDTLTPNDLLLIANHLYPQISTETCSKMIQVVSRLEYEIGVKKQWGTTGGPWEFNLRDTLRWLQVYSSEKLFGRLSPVDFLDIIVCQRFRSAADQERARTLVEEIFGERVVSDNFFKIGESFVQAGKAVSERSQKLQLTSHCQLSHLQSNIPVIESSLLAIKNNWPLIYVGSSNSGKTELVRYLATLTGNKMVEFSMNSDVDSMDILGGYEQVDLTRQTTSIVDKLSVTLKDILSSHFKTSNEIVDGITPCLNLLDYIKSTHITVENYSSLVQRFDNFKHILVNNEEIIQIGHAINQLSKKISEHASVKFEWFDGLLVKAVEQGHWLVLDNANLCSPSVLDRLNSLLEINGSLIINECSLADGQPRILKPHKNFRLFMTMDPKFGELSRAMRNRGVEIHIETLEARSTFYDKHLLGMSTELQSHVASELDIKGLSVTSESYVPSAKFIEPTDSSAYHIALLTDSITLGESTEILAKELATIIPFVSQATLSTFAEMLSKSSEFAECFKSVVSKLLDYTEYLSSTGITSKLHSVYEPISNGVDLNLGSPINYDRFQSLNPLWNVYVYFSLGEHTDENSEGLVHFFEVVSSVFEGLNKLEAVELRGANAKLNELSYIEQGAALVAGRALKNAPKVNIYQLLKGIHEFILKKIGSLSVEEILSSVGLFQSLNRLVLLWFSLFDSGSIKNDAKSRVFQQMIQKWASDSEKSTEVKELKSLLDNFEADLKLNRGQLMNKVWEGFRGSYPQSAGSWSAYDELVKLMREFDDIAHRQFSDSEELISMLGSAMLGMEDAIVTSGSEKTEDAFDKLHSGIKNLQDISSKFLIQRSHNFQESFNLLFNYAISDKTSVDGELLSLAQYAGVGVSAFSGFENKVYPKVFDMLWSKSSEGGVFESKVSSLFTDKFLQKVFVNINNYNDFAGDQLDQTVTDSLEFSKHLIKNSRSVLTDRVAEHKIIIIGWYTKILQLVVDEDISYLESLANDEELVETLTTLSLKVPDPFFAGINQSFLLPALTQSLQSTVLSDIGQAWVLFSIGLVQLYVPDSPFDPAIEDHIIYEAFERKKELCQSIRAAFSTIKSVYFGDGEMLIERYLPSVSNKDIPEKPRVFRTRIPIDNVFEEWQSFMTSTLDLSAVTKFLEAAEDAELSDYQLQMDLFQQNSSSFIERLKTQFGHFADVNEIFYGYIYGLKLGFDLILEGKKAQEADVQVSPLWFINPQALSNKAQFNFGFDKLKEFTKSIDVDSASGERILKFLMDYLLSDSKNDKTGDGKLEQVFQSLYYRWSLRRTRKEQKEAEEGNLFKFKGEVDEDEDFKSLFPDFEEFLQTNDGVAIGKSTNDLEDEQLAISERYIAIFAEKPSNLKTLIAEGSLIARNLIKLSSEFKAQDSNPATFAVVVQALNQSIDAARISSGSSELDFYHGYSPAELKRSVTLIQNLLNSVSNLLEQWPEHDTLKILHRTSFEYLGFPVKTPLARLIQKIEQIYTYISEWEKYASVKVSLKVHFDELTSLIVSWRRLELSCWKSLFRNEEKANEKGNGSWWYNLFETIIMPAYNDEYIDVTELITSINIFMSKSTYGQFQPRLNLLKAFTEHALSISKSNRLKDSLKNLITFYEQFAPIISEALNSERKRLQKDVDEVILLASWKDVNIDALKQSARRSHNNLYKIIRKYRDVLARDVTSLIEQGVASDTKIHCKTPGVYVTTHGINEAPEITKEVKDSDIWETVPPQMKKNNIVLGNMEVFTNRVKSREYPNLNGFTSDVLSEIERLKKETPKEYKEDNKKLVAALKTQKRKLLSDSIRELRRIGLKSHLRDDIHKSQSSSTLILSKAESFRHSKIAEIDTHFFRIVDLIPRLRAAVSSVAEDIPPADAEKGLAIVENLVYVLLNNKKPLLTLSNNFEKLEAIQQTFSRSFLVEKFIARDDVVQTVEDVDHIVKWLPQILDLAIETLGISSKLAKVSSDAGIFAEIKSKIAAFADELRSKWSFSQEFSTAIRSFMESLDEIVVKLGQWRDLYPETGFLATMVIQWIEENKVKPVSSNVEATEGLPQFDSLLKGICSRILVVFQKVTQAQSAVDLSFDDDQWFSESQKELASVVKSLHIVSVVKSFESLVEYVEFKTFSSTDSGIIKSLLGLVQPFLKGYMKLVATVLNKASENYVSVGRSTYVLATILYNLAKDGFCSPQPPTETKQDDNLQDGTGLGDGEGANNASNDVEDDEDLTENAQEPNKEKDENKDEDDDNDDAVDIEGDMAGDLEDLSDQEKSDEEEKDGEEEEEELDEEVDDLDDLDPNAVDDKMWDEEAKEDNKEKDSETVPENSKADDIEAKEEEEPSESRDDKPNEQEGDENDEDNKDNENDEEAEDEEDVGQQDDEVKNEDREELDQNVPETETLDLPEDINLDSGEEDEEEEKNDDGDDEEKMDDGLDDNMDLDDDSENKEEAEEDQEADVEENEDGEDEKEVEEEIADKNDDNYEHEAEDANEEQEEDPLQAGENSEDEDLKENDQTEEDKADDVNDGDQMEGIDTTETGDNNNDDIDMETAVEQESGDRGDGAQTEADQEQEDVGASGTADHHDQAEKEPETQDNARDDIKESMKQLGDSLKEFHRRHQEINEASEKDDTVEQKANERPDEFEHVDGDNTETDTQALGAANKDQASKIDEDMAIDDDEEEIEVKKEEEEKTPIEGEEVVDSDVEEVENAGDEKPDEFNGKNKGGFIGEKNKDTPEDEDLMKAELDEDIDSDEEMDVSLLPKDVIDDGSEFRDIDEARELWRKSELETQDLAANLCEQLRLILEPTLSTKLKGDYKTGKRLNMKRIIPYIASDFRKDKIWLRRTKPSKRQYQIMIAVDDSKSMSESKSVDLAFQSICLVSKALTQLESGGLSIVKFGEDVKVVHPFDKQFSPETGAKIFQKFDFQQTRTNTRKLVSESIEIFNNARALGDSELWQLQIIISDGVCEDHDTLQRLVRRAREEKIMLVFVVIDGINSNESIMDMSQVSYIPDANGNMVLKVNKYLDTFPFEFYVVVHDISELPKMLSLILRQYFQELASV